MSDYMIRAVAADEQIRAFAATTRDMVEFARAAHHTSPVATAALGRLLTGGVMMGCMLKGEKDLLTLQIRGDGPLGAITVTADSSGHAKGYVANPNVLIHANEKGKLDVGGAIGSGTLTVIKDMGLKEPYSGSCALQTGEIAEDLTYYFATSEQVPSAVGLGVLMEKNNTVRQAGGFIIQLMPFTGDEIIGALEKKLSASPSVTTMLDQGMMPEEILDSLLGEFGVTIMEKRDTGFVCGCSKAHYAGALAGLGKKDLEELIAEGEPLEVNCRFCNSTYTFSPEELREIYRKAR